MTGQQILVACHDAALRLESFDRIGALGYRVDAVGNQKGLSKRLSKDSYTLLVHDESLSPGSAHPGATLLVEAKLLADGAAFEEGVKERMDADGEPLTP